MSGNYHFFPKKLKFLPIESVGESFQFTTGLSLPEKTSQYVHDRSSPKNEESSSDDGDSSDESSSDEETTYPEKILNKNKAWIESYGKLSELLLKSRTVALKTCSVCSNEARAICKTCTLKPAFCDEHALSHHLDLSHALIRSDCNNYVDGTEESVKEGSKILFLTVNGWWYARRSDDESHVKAGVWFPRTPSRPSTFIHVDLMRIASVMIIEGMISTEMIEKCMERWFDVAPPKQWKNNFREALKVFSAFESYVKKRGNGLPFEEKRLKMWI